MSAKSAKETGAELLEENLGSMDPIETIIDEIRNSFDSVTAITITHPLPGDEICQMQINVHTSDESASSLEPVTDAVSRGASITYQNEHRIFVAYDIFITKNYPFEIETVTTTPVYRSDDVANTDPISVEDGLSHLRWKLR